MCWDNSDCFSGCCRSNFICDTWMSCPSHYITSIIVPIICGIIAIIAISAYCRYRNRRYGRHNYEPYPVTTTNTRPNPQYAPQAPYPPQGYASPQGYSSPAQGYGSPQNSAGYIPPPNAPAYQYAAPSPTSPPPEIS